MIFEVKSSTFEVVRFAMSLVLGNKSFSVNMIQGPLAGVSCAPFRALVWRYSKPAFTCTEMISCKTLIHQSTLANARFIKKDVAEGPLSFQLSGNDPSELGEATKIATQAGADLIDLNCGCPVTKIRKRGAGSRLLSDATKLAKLIHAMKSNTHLPVSIKIRVQGGSNEIFHQEIVNVINNSGLDFLTVHGRHWTEHYETPCHHDQIQFFVNELNIPVIGNGDIACLASLQKMLATGCAGVMIGRAGVGQPWLIAKLMAELTGEKFQLPSAAEISSVFLDHVKSLITLLQSEKFAILQARKFAKYYARHLSNRNEFAAVVNSCETLTQLESLCQQFFY